MALNQREKALLAIPVLLGGVLAFYYYVHEPLFAHRAMAMTTSGDVRRELQVNQSKLAKERDLNARRVAVTSREQKVADWVPGKNSAALLIWYLSEAERNSGARIKGIVVGEKQEIVATHQGNTEGNAQGNAQTSPLTTTLMRIRLDLKVDATFARHLQFNRVVEKVDLFFNIGALTLSRGGESPIALAGKLLQEGKQAEADELFTSSPIVDGTYQINLYFKSAKPGPTTDPMHFASDPERSDPFTVAQMEELIGLLRQHYDNPDQNGPETKDGGAPGPGQLG